MNNNQLEEGKIFFDKNIRPCTKFIGDTADLNKFEKITLISKFETDEHASNLDAHVSPNIGNKSIVSTPNSDEFLIRWLDENCLQLLCRDFSFDKPVNSVLTENDYRIIEHELFYIINASEAPSNCLLKLSLSKSWIFSGLLYGHECEQFSSKNALGIVFGVHHLDSYLIITNF